MRNLGTIWRREVADLFRSPIAYVVISAVLLILGFMFSGGIVATQQAYMIHVFLALPNVLLFVAPLLTMRTLSEERRLGTDEFLLTSPLSIPEIILGKYLAVLTVYGAILLVTIAYLIILAAIGEPDLGPVLASYLGAALLGAAYIAVGVFASSLSENQIIAGMISLGILLFLSLVSGIGGALSGMWGAFVRGISLADRYFTFLRGIIDLTDIFFFLSFIFLFLFFAVRNVDRRRWS